MKWLKQQELWLRAVVLGGAAVVLVAIIALLSVFVIAPAVRYSQARRLIATDPAGAYEMFYHMGDYRRARERAQEIQDDVMASRSVDRMEFAGVQWLVLEQRDGLALLLREEALPPRAYHGAWVDITWENSAMRSYLNGQWLNRMPQRYRDRVVLTSVFNRDSRFGPDGGENTEDHVFLLSLAEARLYFADDQARIARAGNVNVFWWLRSPGMQADFAATVGANGVLGITGSLVHGSMAANRYVRPAMWVTA
jgi:hypothetical protein